MLNSLIALPPACVLLFGSCGLFSRVRSTATLMQLVGAVFLVVVVLTHVCEAFGWFPGMHWGEPHSPGHYLDLSSAIIAAAAFPLGYLLHALDRRRA